MHGSRGKEGFGSGNSFLFPLSTLPFPFSLFFIPLSNLLRHFSIGRFYIPTNKIFWSALPQNGGPYDDDSA